MKMIVERAIKSKSILQFIIIISLLVLSKQEKRCTKRKQPHVLSKIGSSSWLCGLPNPIDGLTREFCKKMSEATGETDTQIDNSSIEEMKNYFKTVKETKDSVGRIITVCQRIFTIDLASKCVELITNLEKFCFTFSTMESVVIEHIGPATFQNEIGGLNMIVFLMEHLPNTPDPENFIEKCFPELSGNDSAYATLLKKETQINKPAYKDNLKRYKTWWESKGRPKVYCTCAEIVYIPAIYDKCREQSDEVGNLEDYFHSICLEDYKERDSWRESHFHAMLSYNLSILYLKIFLTDVASLAKFGCCTLSSSWQIEHVIKITNFSPTDGADPDFLRLAERAMSTGFTWSEYNEFIAITFSDDLKYLTCKNRIFDKVLDVSKADVSEDQKKGVNAQYKGNFKFYVKNEKSVFNKHIELFIEMMEYSNLEAKGCNELVHYVDIFGQAIYVTPWSQASITNLLQKAKDKRIVIQTAYSCFHYAYVTEYAIRVEKKMLANKPGQKKGETISSRKFYEKAFERFRNILFEKPQQEMEEICDEKHSQYNVKTNENIYKFMKEYIFTETQGATIQELFDNVVNQIQNEIK